MNKLIILLVLGVVVAIPIAAGQLLPWWAAVLVLMVEIPLILVFAPRIISRLIKRHLVSMFQAKSRVLAGAAAEVHEVREVTAPPDLDEEAAEEEGDGSSCRYVQIEFTLTPQPAGGVFHNYGPSDLCLISSKMTVSRESQADADFPTAFAATTRLISADGEVTECDQLSGMARLRMVFSVPQEIAGQVKFLYYFETFGELQLPW